MSEIEPPGSDATAHERGLVSVGYEGRTVEELIDVLRRHHVSLLIDVRLNPVSRRPGFGKRGLGAAINDAGIEYRHARELGNPQDNRAALRAGDPAARARYRSVLADHQPLIADIAADADHRVVALLCVERSHDGCHRRCVAAAVLELSPGLPLVTA